MFCKNCGKEVGNKKFCQNCGLEVQSEDNESNTTQINKSNKANKDSVLAYIDNKIKATTKFSSAKDLVSNSKSTANTLHWVSLFVGIISVILGQITGNAFLYFISVGFILLFAAIEVYAGIRYGMYKRKKYNLSKPVNYEKLKDFLNETLTPLELTNWSLIESSSLKHNLIICRLKGLAVTIDLGKNNNSTQYNIKNSGNPYNHCVHCFRAAIAHPIISAAVEYYCSKDNL